MEKLDNIMKLLNKMENEGYQPTEDEAKMLVQFVDDVMAAIKEIMIQFREMVIQAAGVVTQWWNSLPEELRQDVRELASMPQPTRITTKLKGDSAISTNMAATSGIAQSSMGDPIGLTGGPLVNVTISAPAPVSPLPIELQQKPMKH